MSGYPANRPIGAAHPGDSSWHKRPWAYTRHHGRTHPWSLPSMERL